MLVWGRGWVAVCCQADHKERDTFLVSGFIGLRCLLTPPFLAGTLRAECLLCTCGTWITALQVWSWSKRPGTAPRRSKGAGTPSMLWRFRWARTDTVSDWAELSLHLGQPDVFIVLFSRAGEVQRPNGSLQVDLYCDAVAPDDQDGVWYHEPGRQPHQTGNRPGSNSPQRCFIARWCSNPLRCKISNMND